MVKKTSQGLPYFTYPLLNNYPDLVHFTTTRHGGFSNGEYGGLNVSFAVGEDSTLVAQNRHLIADAFALDSHQLLFGRQIHESNIRVIRQDFFEKSPEERYEQLTAIDSLITNLKNVCLCILTADCAGILLYDPKQAVISVIHAGWRGTVKKIATNVINKMRQEFDCRPADILAVIGPCIGLESYEVGDEVAKKFVEVFGENHAIIDRTYSKPHVAVAAANHRLLMDSGLSPENIALSGVCTFRNNDRFYSARQGDKGRFCSGISMRGISNSAGNGNG
ncbi:MAG: peptidoglycan editing factor PgeF [Cytophagales bacterium]|nr:peptidoglycan editing factor PgeF [Cytophagales bacterium]